MLEKVQFAGRTVLRFLSYMEKAEEDLKMTAMKIGYIGLGLMGKAMARNLLKAGFPVIVHNRSREAVRELVREGAEEAFSPAEVARRVDIVFTNVPNSDTVEQVVFGEDGILAGARPGLIFIDNSTIKPGTAQKIAAELTKVGVMAIEDRKSVV